MYDKYYEEYDCGFWECLKGETIPFVLISQKAKNYWQTLFYWALLISIILFVLLFIFSDSKNSPLIITGVLMIVTAIPFRKISWVSKLLPDSPFFDLALAFFTKSYNVFLIMMIIGVILLVTGITFNLFGIGMNISGFFSELFHREKKGEVPLEEKDEKTFSKEEVKDIVKTEVQKVQDKEDLRKHVKNIVKDELEKVKKK